MHCNRQNKECTENAVNGSMFCKRHKHTNGSAFELIKLTADDALDEDKINEIRRQKNEIVNGPWPMVASEDKKAECVEYFRRCMQYETVEYTCALCGREQDIACGREQ